MKIGYWLSPDEPHLPSPVATSALVDPDFLQKFRAILDTIRDSYRTHLFPYISPFENASMCSYLGYSTCRICQRDNGDSDVLLCNPTLEGSEREYTFPDGLIHYYEAHGVAADPEFVDFIKNFELVERPQSAWERAETEARTQRYYNFLSGSAGLKYTI